jgi:hypothetical protein
LAVLKDIVDFLILLIGKEGARLLREYGAGETPQAPMAPRRLPVTPAESEHLEWKSTAKFNTAFILRKFISFTIYSICQYLI